MSTGNGMLIAAPRRRNVGAGFAVRGIITLRDAIRGRGPVARITGGTPISWDLFPRRASSANAGPPGLPDVSGTSGSWSRSRDGKRPMVRCLDRIGTGVRFRGGFWPSRRLRPRPLGLKRWAAFGRIAPADRRDGREPASRIGPGTEVRRGPAGRRSRGYPKMLRSDAIAWNHARLNAVHPTSVVGQTAALMSASSG